MSLLTDKQWSEIDGQVCLVKEFVPMAKFEGGQVVAINSSLPYASVTIVGETSPDEISGFITHKLDFVMLWAAFNERTRIDGVRLDMSPYVKNPGDLSLDYLGSNEEVWVMWSRKNYKGAARIVNKFLPRLVVMVSPKGGRSSYGQQSSAGPSRRGPDASLDATAYMDPRRDEVMTSPA